MDQAIGKGMKRRIRATREKRQASSDRAMKKRNGNDEVDSEGEEEDAVDTSSGKRVHGSGSGSNRNKVGSKRC